MAKVIKEIIIMLLVCLVALLLLAVVFYNYIPTRKNVAEVSSYKDTAKISELLNDDIDQKDKDVILTYEEGEYEVTSSDLKNYEVTEKYVPGKANPFAPADSTTKAKGSASTNTSTSTDSSSSKGKSTGSSTSKDSGSSEYIKDKGTK